jgi:putative glutamine amidotransferase
MSAIIGITPSPSVDTLQHGTFQRFAMSANYTEAVEAAGGVPVVLPPQRENVDSLLSIVDGVLFSGGGDIDPGRYGDTDRHPTT